MRGLPHYKLPRLQDCIEANLAAGRLVNRRIQCVGIAMNTAAMTAARAERLMKKTEDELGLPCVDPIRTGVAPIVDRLSRIR